FTKTYNATERHTLRQHYLRVHRDLKNQAPEEEVTASKLKLFNYVQQVALISDN
ncbi:MAG TPA: ribosome-associated protein, partial [Lysinibacillus sp.]|nr:ribosome-associated protein [Lysinibacillus sp.]